MTGEYEPSPWPWVADQVELYESSRGTAGTTVDGRPVVILTSVGAKTGKIRKTPLMRVERAAWWERALPAFPDYADHQAKTHRDIPVFVLEPADGP